MGTIRLALPAVGVVVCLSCSAPPAIQIDDVSPTSTAVPLNKSDHNYAASGLIAAVDGSGPVAVAGPPTSWSAPNGSDWVEHVAAAAGDGRLHAFYRLGAQSWKAVDLTEKTGRKVAVVEPASWQMQEGGGLGENLAVPTAAGELLVFRWHSGSDWRAEDVSQAVGRRVSGPVAAWVTSSTGPQEEYIAARGSSSHLLVFHRTAGGVWAVVDVTAATGTQVGAGPTGWDSGSGARVAVRSTAGELLLFTATGAKTWSVENVSARVVAAGQPTPRIEARVATRTTGGVLRLAARSPADSLLLFSLDPIEGSWSLTNVSRDAGREVASAPTFWESGSGGGQVLHLAASAASDALVVFTRESGTWHAVDVTSVTGTAARLRPTSWISPNVTPEKQNVASAAPGGHLVSFSLQPGRGWDSEDGSIAASGRVVVAASQKAGVWRSDDYGRFWRQMSQPQPTGQAASVGTLDVAVVLDVAVSPADPRVVLAGTGSDHRVKSRAGLYRSTDAGGTWKLAAAFTRNGEALPATQVVFATDDSSLVFAAGGSAIVGSADGGASWDTLLAVDSTELVWHLAVSEADARGLRALAALGPSRLWFAPRVRSPGPSRTFDARWFRDTTAVFGAGLPATNTGSTMGVGSHVLAFVPGSRVRLLVADQGRRNQRGPEYYSGSVSNGDTIVDNSTGSLWDVDLSHFDATADTVNSVWTAVPIPPTYVGAGSSGVAYVYTHRTRTGFLVFFANKSTVQVSEGVASAATDWHRLDGLDASRSPSRNTSLVHADPHDLLISPDFDVDLGPADAHPPYDQHSAIRRCAAGRLWMAHDGGITRSSDCGENWLPAEAGLSTLNFINVAVSPRRSGDDVEPWIGPYLYGGETHNDQSFSPDGGKTWKQPRGSCGDCDAWFSDPAQPSHVLRLMPRGRHFDLYVDTLGGPDPLPGPTDTIDYPDYVRPFAISFKVLEGYRPIVYTLNGEANVPGGDYVTIRVEADTVGGTLTPRDRALLRARGTFAAHSGGAVWTAVSGLAGAGSVLPATADVVQASGGHDPTVFYVGDSASVWRSHRNAGDTIDAWTVVVPNVSTDTTLVASDALRFFVNPYDTLEIYVAASDFVRHSTDGGATFPVDRRLDDALTARGAFIRTRRVRSAGGEANARGTVNFDNGLTLLPGESENHADEFILNDMVFDRTSSRRFAVGIAGVFFSPDGRRWRQLVDSRSLPGRPRAAWFDAVTHPDDKSLYVAYHGRGILRIHPIP